MTVSTLIMAGGVGERLWPLGRKNKPKQFLKIKGKNSLIEDAIIRAKSYCEEKNIFIVTGERFRESFEKYLPDFPKENMIFEPIGRDTAAAVALGAYTIQNLIGETVIVTIPADPIIQGEALFTAVMKKAIERADKERLPVMIGIKPVRAETGYGYLHLSDCVSGTENIKVYKIDSFVEKPNQEKAEKLFKDTSYLWNSGMFIWRADIILSAIKHRAPDIYEKAIATYEAISKGDKDLALKEFSSIEKKSIDFAVMEKLTNALCVKGDFRWDDVGSFTSFSRVHECDWQGNLKTGNSFVYDTKDSIVVNDSNTFIAVCGMKDVIVVEHNGAILVYPKGQDNIIKELVAELEARGYKDYL